MAQVVCSAPRAPAVHSTEGTRRGKPAPRPPGEDALVACVPAGRSACAGELNVGSLEGLGSSTRSRTVRPSPSVARPSACRADCCWSLRLAGDDRVCRGSGLRAGLAKAPGCLEKPSSLAPGGRTLQATEPQLAVASPAAGGEGLSSKFPSPKLSRQPGPLLHSGSRRWPSVPANSPLLTARPFKCRARRARGRSPRAPAHFAHPLSGPRPFTASLCMSD